MNELAKAYGHADKRIAELARELDETKIREKVLKDITSSQPPKVREEGTDPPVPPANNENPEDFRSKIRDEVKALNAEDRKAANIEAAGRTMQDHYGDVDKAAEAVRRRASELGVSVEWLRNSAAQSPAAFYATMGITQSGSRSTPAPRSDVRLGDGPKVKTWSYYNQLRKENKSLYNSVEIQNELKSAAMEMGDAFFDT